MSEQNQAEGGPVSGGPGSPHETADGGEARGLEVETVVEAGDWQALEPIEPLVRATVGALVERLEPGILAGGMQLATLALVDDARVAKLNETYRGKALATNVLSFRAPADTATMARGDGEDGASPHYLGDVVMALETVTKEADELAITLKDHFRHLLVHGLLHLLGFDHETSDDAGKMEALEISVLKTLGVANPYVSGFEP